MSVNESLIEQQDDVCDLPDLYTRELLRKKNSFISTNDDVEPSNGGGYREWKNKNGINTSDNMVSYMGKVLQNQGIVGHNESDYYSGNYQEGHSNPVQGEYRGEQNQRLNASEPCYTPHQFRTQNQGHYRTDVYEREVDSRSNFQNRNHNDNSPVVRRKYQNGQSIDQSPEGHNSRCVDKCCSQNKSGNSPNYKLPNHPHSQYYNEMHHNVTSPQFHTPPIPNHFPHPNQYRQCHPIPMCCFNPNETPHRQISPQKSPSTKSDASFKKFYKILCLLNEQLRVQNEQLKIQSEQLAYQKEQGVLLEKQISKLVELSLKRDTEQSSLEKPVKDIEKTKKPETCDMDTMTDLPCGKCISNQRKNSSSESEPETNKKPSRKSVDDSLTLHGVEIPITRDDVSSPPVSMHIDMQEFQSTSSSETEESDTTEDESEPVGWTFYDNVVGQVNNILKTATKKKKKRNVYKDDGPVNHMKRLGLGPLSSPDSDNYPKRVTFNEGSREQVNLRAQSEISMNFNALASKYLTSAGAKVQDISMCNVISGNTNMSLATMRYLERHQIASKDGMAKRAASGKSKKSRHSGEKAVSKFLDITAIRQQPKLLPKDI